MLPAQKTEPLLGNLRRGCAGLGPLWAAGLLGGLIAWIVGWDPWWAAAAAPFVFLGLMFVRPPHHRYSSLSVAPPVRGRWVALNSPADKVPSHGTRSHAQTYAIDVLHPRPPGTSTRIPLTGGFRRPSSFSSFGEPVHAVADGEVVTVVNQMRDHLSRSSWLALGYMMVLESLREVGGMRTMVGNCVVIAHPDGVYSLYGHLRRGSVPVRVGQSVHRGQVIGEVGNSGNSSEPHLHWQLQDRRRTLTAAGVPWMWQDVQINVDEADESWTRGPVTREVVSGVPATGQVFVTMPDDGDTSRSSV